MLKTGPGTIQRGLLIMHPFKSLQLALVLALVLAACESDPGLEPTRSGFSGTIRFVNEWPETTDQVVVVAATKFPPATTSDIVLGEPLPIGVDSVDYTIYSPPLEFSAVGVVWKERDQPWDVTNIIGIYFPTANKFSPGSITIPDRSTLVRGIDMVADLSLARRYVLSGISGMLRVKGSWPEKATSVIVAASYPALPTGLLDVVLGTPIPAPFDSSRYELTLPPATYRLIGALVLEEGASIGLTSLRGLYYANPDDFIPGSITLTSDTMRLEGVDITLDFGEEK